ncbi:FAD-binding oxidoreductase [Gemmobacter sp.]|uniref:NAD(P)/FAD-dependent oxidoreductase n=1 Tax=Gemmobacter sp. TaxID=1898957 RepID=UPI002AFE2C87|nr:FAD-binding oxidoreductase [Gemmobacter sp.]
MPQPPDFDVAIAGAGIVGASAAWHLAGAGLRVAVIDAVGPAAAASGASDGAVSVASKKPGPLARLASAALLYTRVLSQGGPLEGAFHARPSYVFGQGEAELAAMDALIAKLGQIAGPVRVVADGGRGLLPGLGDSVERLVVLDGEGHMPGHKAVRAYLARPGITPVWPAHIHAILPDDTGVTVDLGDRRLRAGRLVAALGVSTRDHFPDLPVLPRAGQLFVTDRGPADALPGSLTAAAYLLAKTETPAAARLPPVVIDPLVTGQFIVGSSREDHGDPSQVDFATLRRLMGRAVDAFPALAGRRVIRAFAGIRAAVADGLPIVGPLPDAPHVLMATGFEGDGICLSALIGAEVARMARGLGPSDGIAADLAALSPLRFTPSRQEGRA